MILTCFYLASFISCSSSFRFSIHPLMAEFRPRFGRLGSIARMEPAPAAPAPTGADQAAARPGVRPQLQPQPTGRFRGTASVPSSPIQLARPAGPSASTASVPTSPIPVATIVAATSSPTQAPAKLPTATVDGVTTAYIPLLPVKPLNDAEVVPSSANLVMLPQLPSAQPQSPPAIKAPSPVKYSPKNVTQSSFSPPLSSPKPQSSFSPPLSSPKLQSSFSPPLSSPKLQSSFSPPLSSPKLQQPAVASPVKTIKPASPPPSPLRLPSPRIVADPEPELAKRQLFSTPAPPPSPQQHKEREDKIVEGAKVVRKASEQPRHHIPKLHNKSWASSDEESSVRMITIAGDNRGAFMELLPPSSSSSNLGSPAKNKHADEAVKVKKDGKAGGGAGLSPLSAFVNSNVQGVNNSILLNASCAHNSPGVHLALSRRPTGRAKEHAAGDKQPVAAHHA